MAAANDAPSPAVEFVWSLITAAGSPLLQAELAHALRRASRQKPPTPAERRLTDLSLLRTLISGEDHPQRDTYDELRRNGDSAPTSHTLLAHYGSWWEACSIAAAMREDGTLPRGPSFGGGALRGRQQNKAYTTDQVIGAVRLCAFSLGREPSSHDYFLWRPAALRTARQRDRTARIPSLNTLFAHSSNASPWRTLIARAAITDRELRQARTVLLRITVKNKPVPFLTLPLSEAAQAAADLGGSLDWLAGRTTEPSPTADPELRFDADGFRKLRDMSGVSPERVSEAAGLTLGQSRRLLSGTYEPTLAQVIELASVLGVSAASLCTQAR
ncbi:MAG: hypothetical protein QOH16_3116 [Gaiellaceae bacterium]|nr:hypothetical protein [Gaiellaceae bacterium]